MPTCRASGVLAQFFLAYTGLGVGIAGGAITFGGISVGSYRLIAAGSALGTGAADINSIGHAMVGNYIAAGLEVSTMGLSRTYSIINNSRRLTSTEKTYLNLQVLKSQGTLQLGSIVLGHR
ncbi:MAG: hypothetical protein JJU35_14480 [Balneolales bacterium]|nr:hypothetical protein [Balneolales bacterium]